MPVPPLSTGIRSGSSSVATTSAASSSTSTFVSTSSFTSDGSTFVTTISSTSEGITSIPTTSTVDTQTFYPAPAPLHPPAGLPPPGPSVAHLAGHPPTNPYISFLTPVKSAQAPAGQLPVNTPAGLLSANPTALGVPTGGATPPAVTVAGPTRPVLLYSFIGMALIAAAGVVFML
ncbi:hypothetical protein CORC01_01702 [Colletotrichum orchidophilum]|uniref:Uncharacterized protein n=1 Tax=Colletotrichum orchidophilum TaxID=1209926 RepID=A0A1G4BNF1_9PEZI|nr:uncharacterized protein CORC01_01702 [Colletotrichum orchidophilum]OHF02944.1 hypothetical protein CORC01_01702 [Colletotrichum orchidophilum]